MPAILDQAELHLPPFARCESPSRRGVIGRSAAHPDELVGGGLEGGAGPAGGWGGAQRHYGPVQHIQRFLLWDPLCYQF